MSFIDELKRRNVFKVGIAYGVTAWIVLQVADLVFENIGAPEWMIKSLMFLVALGFITALVVAWAYEMTPEGIKRESDVDRTSSMTQQTGQKLNAITLAAVILLLVVMALDRFVFERPESQTLAEASPKPAPITESAPVEVELEPAANTDENSIAVLPFVDMSPEGDQVYFADGISEEILNVLVKTQDLKVAGRTSSFQFRNREEDLRLIGEQLGVAHILEGSIRKAGDRLRITAQLVKADDGFHLWSETYDRDLVDVFAIQDEIARAITDALAVELQLGGNAALLASVQTTNMDAYDRYLEARGLLSNRVDFQRMISLLTEATELDPDFAEAWASLAQAWALTFYYDIEPREVALRQAETYSRKALALDPTLADAHTALANVLRDQGRWNEAGDSYQDAFGLNPNDVEAHIQYGQMLIRVGDFDGSLDHGKRAAELDPLSWLNQSFYALALYLTGDKQRAYLAMDKANDLSGGSRSLILRFTLRLLLSDQNIEGAKEAVAKFKATASGKDFDEMSDVYQIIDVIGEPEKARTILRSIDISNRAAIERNNTAADLFWAAYFEDFELADRWMAYTIETAEEQIGIDGTWLAFPAAYPLFDRPGFAQMMKVNRLDTYWRVHGWPNFCWPVDELDFECGPPRQRNQ